MDLYHFTCQHGAEGIRDDGVVIPVAHLRRREPGLPEVLVPWAEFVWFTDLDLPLRDCLGLTSYMLRCDRTEHRFRALSGSELVPWMTVRKRYPWRVALEVPGTRPVHWYVSTEPVPVVEAPR